MPFGIYIHWPFCESKCPYCDFNSHVASEIDVVAWRDAYLKELDYYLAETRGRTVTSVFFGGGTPTLMPPKLMATVISHIKTNWVVADDFEITAEANPSSAEIAVFERFSAAGVNRLSIGVQSFRDEDLVFLGRPHTAASGRSAIDSASKLFDRWSFDLIYARPGQSVEDWRLELGEALDYGPTHLSLYQLTIEPGTDFHRQRVAAADEDAGSALFELTQEILEDARLPGYEISNHAATGEECRHNLVYWQGGDYLGIGPGAHGRLTASAAEIGSTTETIQAFRNPAQWLTQVNNTGSGVQKRHKLSSIERRDELILMGLRLRNGISLERFENLTGGSLREQFAPETISRLVEGGFLEVTDTRLKATPAGRLRLNAVLGALLV